MDTVALVGEGGTVVGHFRCSGTQTGLWMGRSATGRSFYDVREVIDGPTASTIAVR
jgi:hypothetical protein